MPIQADHYIIRMLPPEPADWVIDRILSANGYVRGTATVDFKIDSYATNEAYMTGLVLAYEQRGFRVDPDRTKMHSFSGGATGKLIAVFRAGSRENRHHGTAANEARTPRENRDLFYNVGNRLFREGNYTGAIQNFRDATVIDPSDAHAYFNIASCYHKLGQREQALAHYERCFANCGDLTRTTIDQYGLQHGQGLAIDTIIKISNLLSEMDRTAEALRWLDKLLEIAPGHRDAYYNKAAFLYNSGRYQEALEMAQKCIELGDPAGRELKAIIAEKLGR